VLRLELTGIQRRSKPWGRGPTRCEREGTCAVVDSVRDLLLGLLKLLDVRSAGSRFMVVLLCTHGSTSRKC
jgi:hypothetical protein